MNITNLKRKAVSVLNYAKFIYFLSHGVFGKGTPEVALKVLAKFLSLEAPYYSKKTVMGRCVTQSTMLLNVLVQSYIETKSDITLNQILEVLKREFLKREDKNYGRKQF